MILALRGICAIGIIVAHVYPNLFWFAYGYTWRVQVLFLVGGIALLADRSVLSTIKYVAAAFFGYMVFWHAIYGIMISMLPEAERSVMMAARPLWELLSIQFIQSNGHGIGATIGTWFLLPYGAASVIGVALWPMLRSQKGLAAALGVALVFIGWSMGSIDPPPEWTSRIFGQTTIALGYMLVGAWIMSNEHVLTLLRSGWLAAVSLVTFTWLGTAFYHDMLTISWLTANGDIWSDILQSFAVLPALFWVSDRLSGSDLLKKIGAASKDIMTHHLAFALTLNLMFIWLGVATADNLKLGAYAFRHHLWPVYLIGGIAIPLAIRWLSGKVSSTIKRHPERSPPAALR